MTGLVQLKVRVGLPKTAHGQCRPIKDISVSWYAPKGSSRSDWGCQGQLKVNGLSKVNFDVTPKAGPGHVQDIARSSQGQVEAKGRLSSAQGSQGQFKFSAGLSRAVHGQDRAFKVISRS
jgi:hypothetical protein